MQIQITPMMWIAASIIGSISAIIAHRRGQNPYLWFAVGFLFGIFGIFAIFFAPKPKKQTATPPVFTVAGPSDKYWFYLDGANAQKGPMSRDAIQTALRSGKIDHSNFIWHEGLPEWQPLKDFLKQT